ncbi:MAG: hypothetical protein ISR65_17610 [Bacteriovoracaceae bacterium]|nr:hypothetical protein [Bacteriovoracaceae bacterium]
MNLKVFLDKYNIQERHIKRQDTSKNEISDLFKIVNRDIQDSSSNEHLSIDWKFGIAYNAALKLCTILVRASGYRISSGAHHFITIMLLPSIMGPDKKNLSNYFDKCRIKRNRVEYEVVGGINEDEALELIENVVKFKKEVEEWMLANYSELVL